MIDTDSLGFGRMYRKKKKKFSDCDFFLFSLSFLKTVHRFAKKINKNNGFYIFLSFIFPPFLVGRVK